MNPWMTTFVWLWFNDDDFFRYTSEDFDRKARQLKEDGIDLAIYFSPVHFRWSFRPYWPLINETIKKLTDACHKYGIKVVEHHSARLSFDPHNQSDWDYIDRFIGKKGSSVDSWKGLREYLVTDPDINGMPLSSLCQVDGRTGTCVRNNYHSRSMCFNNPHFVKEYFTYLETVYALGVDGIMTDDVQYDLHACTCQHCRALFKQETGYDLPDPEHWEAFYGDFDNPVFVAWKRFRMRSADRFQQQVNRHFESLGLKLLRPNYISDVLRSNWSAYAFENCAHLWDYIFQENFSAGIIGSCNLTFMAESLHRFAMARPCGVPSMSHFYPDTVAELYLSWALAHSWGQIYLGSGIGVSQSDWEKPFRTFERKHEACYTNPRKHADAAFYLSANTRDYVRDGEQLMDRMIARIQGAYLCGVQCDMVFADTSPEILHEMPCIVLCDAAMLSQYEIDRLCDYLHAGGRIIVEGLCGVLDSDGARRDYDVVEHFSRCGDVCVAPQCEALPQQGTYLHRYDCLDPAVPAPCDRTAELVSAAQKTVLPFLKPRRLQTRTQADVIASFLEADCGYTVHLYNNQGLIPAQGTMVSRNWEYPNFKQGAVNIEHEISVTLRRCDQRPISSAVMVSPEFSEEIPLQFSDDGTDITFTVPASTFAGYLLIVLRQ